MARSTTSRRGSAGRRSPGQWGTIQQLPSGRWRAFYRLDGRRLSAPSTFATKEAASAWLAAEHSDRARGTWRDPSLGAGTLRDFARDWIEARADLAPRTADYYRRTIDNWITPRIGASSQSRGVELGAMAVADITPSVVRAWYAIVLQSARARAGAQRPSAARAVHPARRWAEATGRVVATSGRLSPQLVAEWLAAGAPSVAAATPKGSGRTGDTAAANAYRVLRAILSTAVADGLLATHPCQIKGAGGSRSAERGTATPQEVAALARHMPRRLSAAVTLAAWSGLRYGELFALARRHVDLATGAVHVERTLQQVPGRPIAFGPTKTVGSRRTVHLPRQVVAVLERHLSEFVEQHPDALLFTLESGAPVSSSRLSSMFGRARAAIERTDLTWHDLRHTGATLAYRIGASVPDVQKRLGHTTMRAAQIYAHAADDSDRLLAERLDALLATGTPAPRLRAV